jgi:hypothetical protein
MEAGMDLGVANRIIELIHAATGINTIVCDAGGVIVAAKVAARVGNSHAGSRRILEERLPMLLVTREEEEASGGMVKAGVNLPIIHQGEWIGTFGIAGVPETAVPMARMIALVFDQELQEAARRSRLLDQARKVRSAIDGISSLVGRLNADQDRILATVQDMTGLLERSAAELNSTDRVVETLQGIANQTNLLGLNAAIEAAHARERGAGFAIVAEEVRKLSDQSGRFAEEIKESLAGIQGSMAKVVDRAGATRSITEDQSRSMDQIVGTVDALQDIGRALLEMAEG